MTSPKTGSSLILHEQHQRATKSEIVNRFLFFEQFAGGIGTALRRPKRILHATCSNRVGSPSAAFARTVVATGILA
jgi:hypothetical protein